MEAAVDPETIAQSMTISLAPASSSSDTSPNGTEPVPEPVVIPSTSAASTPAKSSRSGGKSAKSAAAVAAAAAAVSDGNGSISAKGGVEKEERRGGQKASKSSRHNRQDHDGTSASAEVEGKKFKKEPKEPLVGSVESSTPTASVTSSFTTAGYPASSYLQGLASLPHPYASLFAAAADPATAAAANAFLTASHFGYATGPTDLSSGKDNGTTGRNHSNSGALLNSLNSTDTSALRQLINGYREAAALLSRTADELESFLCTRK